MERRLSMARSGPRFRGEEEEPRPGVRKGHIQGALNLHYGAVVNADGTFIAPTRFAELLHQAGIDPSKPLVTSCGSGVTAAILTLGLTEIGAKTHALYDGSWTEWGSSNKPIETGA